jgi:hypothetical protein
MHNELTARIAIIKVRPDCSCSVSCVYVNVNGFTSTRSHVLGRFATVSVELSVPTDNSQREQEHAHEQSGHTIMGTKEGVQ